jgi:lipopolysaccharide heptosyltransferase II
MASGRESRRADPHVSIRAVPWHGTAPPTNVLAIGLQAMGDVVITLPYLLALQHSLPGTDTDFLTRHEDTSSPRALRLFRSVEQLFH